MSEMNKTLVALVLAAIIITQTALLPVPHVVGQAQFEKYELYGPRVDGIDITIYSTIEAEVLALQKGDIDMVDWPLPADKVPEIQANPRLSIMTFPDYGYSYIGVNLRRPPLNDVRFRQALMYLVDRDRIVSEGLKGLGNVLPAGLVGPAYADWQNTNIREYTFNPAKAAQILDEAGYRVDPSTGKRIDPTTGAPIRDLVVLARIDDPIRKLAADLLAAEAQNLGILIVSDARERGYIADKVQKEYDYDMFTGKWILGHIPTWLCDYLHSDMLPERHNMEPFWPNFVGFNNPDYDALAYKINYGNSIAEAKDAALKVQVILAEQLPYLPLYQQVNVIAVNTADWEGYVRSAGRVDAAVFWSAFNVHKKGTDFGGTWRLGFKSDIEKMNPFDSTWYWDWMVLNEVYDTMLASNPLKPLELVPWMAASWSTDSWEYAPGKTAPVLTFVLADNIKWHDGTEFTSKDVKFTIDYLRDKQSAYWIFYNKIPRVETPDALTVRVYTNETSPWWELWVGGLPILPEHIWSEVEDPSAFEAWREGKLIGTGPFKLTEYKPGEYVRLSFFPEYFRRPTFTKAITLEAAQVTQGEVSVLDTPPVMAEGAPVENAAFAVNIKDAAGTVVQTVTGNHKGGGVYSANIDTANLAPRTYTLEGTLTYAVAGHENVLTVTKQLTVNAAFPTALVAGIVVLVIIIVGAGFVALRRRKKSTSEK